MLTAVLIYLYGQAVAKLYTFHSYRSGLATALHAAGVEDSMVQLICRWMCPESLHAYRRMGTAEHERLISGAARQNVDSIQSVNVPRVTGDAGYAEVLQQMANSSFAMQREYATAMQHQQGGAQGPPAALHATEPPPTVRRPSDPRPPHAAAGPDHRPPPTATQPNRPRPPQTAPVLGSPTLTPLTAPPQPHASVIVPNTVWPAYRCTEHGGKGWDATVVSVTRLTAVVRFQYAHTRDGRPYQDERLPWCRLCSASTEPPGP